MFDRLRLRSRAARVAVTTPAFCLAALALTAAAVASVRADPPPVRPAAKPVTAHYYKIGMLGEYERTQGFTGRFHGTLRVSFVWALAATSPTKVYRIGSDFAFGDVELKGSVLQYDEEVSTQYSWPRGSSSECSNHVVEKLRRKVPLRGSLGGQLIRGFRLHYLRPIDPALALFPTHTQVEVTCEDVVTTTNGRDFATHAKWEPRDADLRRALGEAARSQVRFGSSFQLALKVDTLPRRRSGPDGPEMLQETWEYTYVFQLCHSSTRC